MQPRVLARQRVLNERLVVGPAELPGPGLEAGREQRRHRRVLGLRVERGADGGLLAEPGEQQVQGREAGRLGWPAGGGRLRAGAAPRPAGRARRSFCSCRHRPTCASIRLRRARAVYLLASSNAAGRIGQVGYGGSKPARPKSTANRFSIIRRPTSALGMFRSWRASRNRSVTVSTPYLRMYSQLSGRQETIVRVRWATSRSAISPVATSASGRDLGGVVGAAARRARRSARRPGRSRARSGPASASSWETSLTSSRGIFLVELMRQWRRSCRSTSLPVR